MVLAPKVKTEVTGWVFDVQGYSVHDGPGCRTLVFMKGCPLRCEWCSNPEGWGTDPVLLFRATKCRRKDFECTRCVSACPSGALELPGDPSAPPRLDRELCHRCTTFECTRACNWEALAVCGRTLTLSELMRIVDRDRQYWGGKGGITFTGGEPLFQRAFILQALRRCKEAYVHTAVETCGYVPTDFFMEAMAYVDWAFIDIKHMDPERHREKTGASNRLILDNVRALATSGWPGRLVIRTPIIEGFNDSAENQEAVAGFLTEIGVHEINILPFHRLGDSKWTQLGLTYPYRDAVPPSMERLGAIQQIFLKHGIACYLGSYTPF